MHSDKTGNRPVLFYGFSPHLPIFQKNHRANKESVRLRRVRLL